MRSSGQLDEEPKYTVFPFRHRFAHGAPLEEGTYFVLRDSDILATSLLWQYVHSIQTLLELDRSREVLSEGEREYLRDTESRVTKLAGEWQKRGRGRLPD